MANQQINNHILTCFLIGFQTKYIKAFKDISTWPSLQFGFDQSKSQAFHELKSNWKSNPLNFSLSSNSSLSWKLIKRCETQSIWLVQHTKYKEPTDYSTLVPQFYLQISSHQTKSPFLPVYWLSQTKTNYIGLVATQRFPKSIGRHSLLQFMKAKNKSTQP